MTKEKATPHGDRVIIRVDVQPTQTDSGIYMATATEDNPEIKINHGTIMGIGRDVEKDIPEEEKVLKPGQRVVFNKYSCLKIWPHIPGLKDFVVLDAKDVLAMLYPEEEKQEDAKV